MRDKTGKVMECLEAETLGVGLESGKGNAGGLCKAQEPDCPGPNLPSQRTQSHKGGM